MSYFNITNSQTWILVIIEVNQKAEIGTTAEKDRRLEFSKL